MRFSKVAASLIAVMGLSTQATADNIRINGFANFTAGMASSDDIVLGYDDNVDLSNQSLFALQVSSDISDKITATAQLMARGSEDYNADFEWAYLNYQYNNNLSFKAGRFRLPLFNYSESLDVAYSYHWLAVPSTIYNVPFNNIDGFSATYSTYVNGWDVVGTAALGTFKGETLGTTNQGNNTVLVSIQASNDALTLRGVLGRTTTTVDVSNSSDEQAIALNQGFEAIEQAGFGQLSDSLRIDDDTGEFVGLSAMYDNMDYFFGGEWTSIEVAESFANKDVAFYVTAGARLGKWTPSLTYEKFESDVDIKFADQIDAIATSGLPTNIAQTITGIAVGVQASQESSYSVTSATLRYDLDASIALKADISKVDDDIANNDGTLMRFALNYVF